MQISNRTLGMFIIYSPDGTNIYGLKGGGV